MNIGVNIVNLYPGKIGGAEQYVRNVIGEMCKQEGVLLLVLVNSEAASTFSQRENVVICQVDEKRDRDTQLNYYIDYYNISIMFCPLFFISPADCSIPMVASILDVQHEFFPEFFSDKVLEEIRRSTKDTLKIADGIITISEFSKRTIIEKYGISKDKIKVTYLNSDNCFDKSVDDKKLRYEKERIGGDYIFYPANTWPHKNHINLLKAYKILKEKYRSKLKLAFTGGEKQKQSEITQFIVKHNLKDDVVYLGYREQEDMPYIFKNATIVAFPSFFEGFGIPLVEAMRAGVALACSECGSIPEVAGDAAIYFDAYNPEDIAEKLYQLEENAALRKSLIVNGEQQAKKYSWYICASETINYLKDIEKKYALGDGEKTRPWNDEYPLVSIITPSYNQGEFIKATIESVLQQDYPRIEYIVMDGGSSDNTIEILKSYGNKIQWFSGRDKGQADAVNKGIEKAKGDIIGWLNSDDTYLEDAVSTMVEYFRKHPSVDMVYGEGYYTDKEGNIIDRYLTEMFSKNRLAEQCIICQPTAFFTKDAFLRSGMLDVEHQLSMDYELWMKIAKTGKISYIPDYIATSRMYEENKTMSRRDEVFKETCSAVKKHYGYVPISWIDGYADYLCQGGRGVKFAWLSLKLFIKYNRSNPTYCKRGLKIILRHRGYLAFRWAGKFVRLEKESENRTELYDDKWMSKEYIVKLDDAAFIKRIIIKGNKYWPIKKKIELRVLIDEKLLLKKRLFKNGEFIMEIPIDKGKDIIIMKIIANKTFCPLNFGGEDTRRLSCQIEDICLEYGEDQ